MDLLLMVLIVVNVLVIGMLAYIFFVKPRTRESSVASRMSTMTYGTLGSVADHGFAGSRKPSHVMHRPTQGKGRMRPGPPAQANSDEECVVVDSTPRKNQLHDRNVPAARGREIPKRLSLTKGAEGAEHILKRLSDTNFGISSNLQQFRTTKMKQSKMSHSLNFTRSEQGGRPMTRSLSLLRPAPYDDNNRVPSPRRSRSSHECRPYV
eukprot:GEMP01065273.1.p1 GENE.GEMP01065273.1~~GEMP01065273.1.p1  ORF type:complete len:208 (+),score=37.32 GEMP01065273.1:429-1052(+)